MDKAFSGLGIISILLLAVALLVILLPIFVKGFGAFVFKGTIEHRQFLLEQFGRGNQAALEAETAKAEDARGPLFRMIADFEEELKTVDIVSRLEYKKSLDELKAKLRAL